MAINVMENYVSVEEYARLCGKTRRTIMDRIKAKSISVIRVDGYYAVNTAASPPKHRIIPARNKGLKGVVQSQIGRAHV